MFYSSYASFWRLCVPDWPTLQAQVVFNLTEMLKEPAVVVFGLPARGFPSPLLAALTIAISVGVLRGVYTRLRQSGVHPIHLCLAAYVPIVLVWNYTLMDRFLFLFLPVFALGAWTEIAGLSAGLRQVFLEPKPWLDRAVSTGLAAALAALLLQAAWRYAVDIPRANRRMTDRRERLLESKREAWRWIREHAPAQAPLIAYEDVTAALATGRPAIRPMAFSTAAFYLQSEPLLQRELEQIGDVAQAAQAQFWLRSDDDFALETGQEKITLAVDGWLQEFPVVFQDELGFIRIHQLFHRSKD